MRFRYSSGSTELQQVRLLVRFALRLLRFSTRTYPYFCTAVLGLQYVALAIIPSDSGEWMHRDKIPPQQMYAACSIVTRGSCCNRKCFAEFNGNCESFCSLEQLLVALLCTAHEGISASGTYHPKTEGYTRRYLYRPPYLLYCGGRTWTRISRQPINTVTLHFFQQTLSEPLTIDDRSERFLFR